MIGCAVGIPLAAVVFDRVVDATLSGLSFTERGTVMNRLLLCKRRASYRNLSFQLGFQCFFTGQS
jgi:hypothetical protein